MSDSLPIPGDPTIAPSAPGRPADPEHPAPAPAQPLDPDPVAPAEPNPPHPAEPTAPRPAEPSTEPAGAFAGDSGEAVSSDELDADNPVEQATIDAVDPGGRPD